MRNARMGSMDAARCAGKNAAANVTMAMPMNATRIVNWSLELKPYKMQKHGIHYTEDGGVGPDPQCDCEDRNGGKNGRFRQLAKRVAKTLDNSHHGSTSALQHLPHLLQQAAYQVIVEEVFGLQEVTPPSQNNPEPNCPNSQNSVRKRTGRRTGNNRHTEDRRDVFLYLEKSNLSPGRAYP